MNVDIIIPSYHGTYLSDALDSCIKQTYKNIRITVIDDNSPNDIEKICSKFSNINYIRSEKNKGPAAARNLGIQATSGNIISFLDDDDIMDKDKIFYSIKEFEQDKNVGMTCGNYRIFVDRKNLRPPFYKNSPTINWNTLIKQNLVASGSVSIRRSVLDNIGLFNEKFWIAEDYDLWLRCSEKYKIKYIPKVLYFYSWINKVDSSLTKRADIQSEHDKNLKIIKDASIQRINNAKNI